MDYLSLTDPIVGDDTLVEIVNRLGINIERLNAENAFNGCLYIVRAPYTLQANSVAAIMNFQDDVEDAIYFDRLGILDRKNYEDFIVPVGFKFARLSAYLPTSGYSGATFKKYFVKNRGTTSSNPEWFPGSMKANVADSISVDQSSVIATGWLSVKPLDRFGLAMDYSQVSDLDFEEPYGTLRIMAMELRR